MIEVTNDLIGRVAMSRAGRDRGRAFLIVGLAEEAGHVLLADGGLRKLAKPKRKKARHIALERAEAPELRKKLLDGKAVLDAEIRSCLMQLGYNRTTPAIAPRESEKEESACRNRM